MKMTLFTHHFLTKKLKQMWSPALLISEKKTLLIAKTNNPSFRAGQALTVDDIMSFQVIWINLTHMRSLAIILNVRLGPFMIPPMMDYQILNGLNDVFKN